MSPPCPRCELQRVINLEMARKLGITAGALAGTVKGAYTSLYAQDRLSLHASGRFPLNRISAAVVAGATEGIAGVITAHQFFQHLMPIGEGAPWFCLGCGHAFRQSMD